MAKNDIGGVWRTVGGRRIFIKDGEDLETAMKKSGKFKKSGSENNNEKGKYDYSDFTKSKVKDTLYHGTDKDFDKFDIKKSDEGNTAIFFADHKDYAESEAYVHDGNKMYEVKINIQNPKIVELNSKEFADPDIEKNYIQQAKKEGKDSVIFKGINKEGKVEDTFYAVFYEEQIKINKKYKI